MSAAEHRSGGGAQVTSSVALALQCVSSVVGTMVGEALGDTLVEKLVAGLLLCFIGAFLTAPGRHHRRRVVAVAVLLASLEALRRAADAPGSAGHRPREPGTGSLMPANWVTIGLATTVGFGVGSLGTTAVDGWVRDSTATTVSVPAVAGESAADAGALLKQSGLAAVRAGAPSASVPNGKAIRTAPRGGTTVRIRSTVTLYVSSGSAGRPVTIPCYSRTARVRRAVASCRSRAACRPQRHAV